MLFSFHCFVPTFLVRLRHSFALRMTSVVIAGIHKELIFRFYVQKRNFKFKAKNKNKKEEEAAAWILGFLEKKHFFSISSSKINCQHASLTDLKMQLERSRAPVQGGPAEPEEEMEKAEWRGKQERQWWVQGH